MEKVTSEYHPPQGPVQSWSYRIRHHYDGLGREELQEQDYDGRPGFESSTYSSFDSHGNILVQGNSGFGQRYEIHYYYLYDEQGRLLEAASDSNQDGINESISRYLYADNGMSRKVVTTYDDGHYQSQTAVDELLDEDGRVIQQESDYNFDGSTDYRTTNLYSGDLLLSTIYESWYVGRNGQRSSWSQATDYDYDNNGFLIALSYDTGMDGADSLTSYQNDTEGRPIRTEYYYRQGRQGGQLALSGSMDSDYGPAGRIRETVYTDATGRSVNRSVWKWHCDR